VTGTRSTSPAPRDQGRAIDLEVEVEGTPEQVWQAIATGPGVTAWYMPMTIDGRPGGTATLHLEGPSYPATIDGWEPGRRFRYTAEGDRALAFEFLVEARSGVTCVVRVVNSGFGEGDDWDAEYDAMQQGWPLFLRVLQLHLAHFPGQPCAPVLLQGMGVPSRDETWASLLDAVGLGSVVLHPGAAVTLRAPAAPDLTGTVDSVSRHAAWFLLDGPGPGVAFLAAEGDGPWTSVSAWCYLYGAGAEATAAAVAPPWRAHVAERFPAEQPHAAG